MPDSKISALTAAGTILGSEQLVVVQSAQSRKLPISSVGALIAEQLLTGDTSPVTFNSIPQTFRNLLLKIYCRHTEAVTDNYVLLRFNNDSGANYDFQHALVNNAVTSFVTTLAATSLRLGDFPGANSTRTTQMGAAIVEIPHYAGATFEKLVICRSGTTYLAAGNATNSMFNSGGWRSASPITRIDVLPTSGNFKAGSLFSLYGTP